MICYRIEVRPDGHIWSVWVDDVKVGLGGWHECAALSEELKEDPGKAEFVKNIMSERVV